MVFQFALGILGNQFFNTGQEKFGKTAPKEESLRLPHPYEENTNTSSCLSVFWIPVRSRLLTGVQKNQLRKPVYFYFLTIISLMPFLTFFFFLPKEMLISLVVLTRVERSVIIHGSLVKPALLIFCVT